MSTVSRPKPPKSPPPEPDPFRYGWRYVRVEHPDGTVCFDQIPLTLEDVLHPEVGDFIVQTDGHDSDLNYLKDVFKAQLADDPLKAVISDCRVDWNLPGVKPLGPDVAVFRGIQRHRDWSTFDVQAEGAEPLLVVEVTSPDTRQNDVVTKVDYYHRAKVPLYVIADVREQGEDRVIELIGYRYQRTGYQRIPLDERGWIWLEPVQLWLGLSRDRLGNYERLACSTAPARRSATTLPSVPRWPPKPERGPRPRRGRRPKPRREPRPRRGRRPKPRRGPRPRRGRRPKPRRGPRPRRGRRPKLRRGGGGRGARESRGSNP